MLQPPNDSWILGPRILVALLFSLALHTGGLLLSFLLQTSSVKETRFSVLQITLQQSEKNEPVVSEQHSIFPSDEAALHSPQKEFGQGISLDKLLIRQEEVFMPRI